MSIGMAASFNTSLWRSIGDVVGREARGAANANLYHTNALTFWAPNINIARDSRWGRNQETPGEDPHTNSEYAKALVTGMQGDDPEWLQISACAKHFAVHSWNTPSDYMAYPTAQDLADTYFPAFQAAAGAGVSGFMCSYNGVDNLPMCAQHNLLTKVRNEWNFSGYITGDCGAVGGPWYASNNWTSAADQVQQSFTAGMDTNCGGGAFAGKEMLAVLLTHPAIRAQADAALTHLLTVQFRLGMFEKPQEVPGGTGGTGGTGGGSSTQPAWSKFGQEQINTVENRNLVLEAAQQGLVLLKNAKPTSGGGGRGWWVRVAAGQYSDQIPRVGRTKRAQYRHARLQATTASRAVVPRVRGVLLRQRNRPSQPAARVCHARWPHQLHRGLQRH